MTEEMTDIANEVGHSDSSSSFLSSKPAVGCLGVNNKTCVHNSCYDDCQLKTEEAGSVTRQALISNDNKDHSEPGASYEHEENSNLKEAIKSF